MKTAYFDCFSGISGDMVLGALVDVGVPIDAIQQAVDSLGLPDCRLEAREVRKNGFRATQVVVHTPREHHHRHLHHIVEMIRRSSLCESAKEQSIKVFTRLGEAEARVHGVPLEKVHFHEVGAADSIVDIVGSVFGLNYLGVEAVYASPIPAGGGTVRIAHGEVSVPAPATAELLRGVPLLPCDVQMEMTTPTGAAFITTFAQEFGPLPAMEIQKIGYGAGSRDIPHRPNVLRLFIGEIARPRETSASVLRDRIWVVQTNYDDLSAEVLGYTLERLWELGVLDLFTTPIHMKKNRPGVQLTVLCNEELVPAVESLLFRETTTLGVRFWPVDRHVLPRQVASVKTRWGEIRGKLRVLPDGAQEFSPEFEACREIARGHQIPLREVYEAAEEAFRQHGVWKKESEHPSPSS
ncbi:nickel pincer cofactor biosynthesis protein LarC [Thermogutta sp.]|uniref:nickel pincer cofactor biosynthesis protein LarC n=1 Tax=Thermogutta sp. TaxID=1962930 RepID=UPI00322093A0